MVRAGFTGHSTAAGELALALYRAYDPGLGRWLSEDPISLSGGLNLYSYVRNNPINMIDPLGLKECEKPCDQLLKEILDFAKKVTDRYQEYSNPKWRLPLKGRMSRHGHIRAIESDQQGLRNRIQDYNDQNCPTPLPTSVEEIATRPTPLLTPSPVDLPELPTPTPEQINRVGVTLTGILIGAAIFTGWLLCPIC